MLAWRERKGKEVHEKKSGEMAEGAGEQSGILRATRVLSDTHLSLRRLLFFLLFSLVSFFLPAYFSQEALPVVSFVTSMFVTAPCAAKSDHHARERPKIEQHTHRYRSAPTIYIKKIQKSTAAV